MNLKPHNSVGAEVKRSAFHRAKHNPETIAFAIFTGVTG